MSQENVERVRAVFEDFLAGEREFGAGLLDPEIEWDSSELPMPDISGVYRGSEAVRQFWRQWLAAWEAVHFSYELVDAGDSVVVLVDQRMRGRSTGIEVPFGRYAQVYTFRDGLVVHWKAFMSQSQALEAAGPSERDAPSKAIGVITGTGTHVLPGLRAGEPEAHHTPYGEALVSRTQIGGAEILHVSRHGDGHRRLSNQVDHRANIAALAELGADAVIGVTVCGAVDPQIELGSLIVFDDLHFLANRLADGAICTFHDTPGDPRRGHWIFEEPFSRDVRAVLFDAAGAAPANVRDGGCYGHVDGPRFNTRAEIRSLAQAGVSAVSQTAGPETVLCGEAGLPYALLGYATDYANGVTEAATGVDQLLARIAASTETFSVVLAEAVPRLAGLRPAPPGVVHRFE